MWRRLASVFLFLVIASLVIACEAISHANDYSTATTSNIDNCAVGTLSCNGSCVAENTENCGTCGHACSGAEVCSAHTCSAGCTDGTTLCGGNCVDTQTDNKNCGQCGGPEDAGVACTVCVDGQCQASCEDNTTQCGTTCADTTNDPNNCGACGKTCGADQVCINSTCGGSCGSFTDCNGSCVDTKTDPDNCDGCKNRCAKPAGVSGAAVCLTTTVGGVTTTGCHVACAQNLTTCGSPGTPSPGTQTCVDTMTDPANCGGCGKPCGSAIGPNAQTCTNGVCVSVLHQ